jgi:nucleoside-diphosphate-sugar epimerase
VYGAGVKANFRALLQLVERGIPLPLASVRNRRSFVSLGNLVAFIQLCMRHPRAANETFLISDGEDQSTPDLLRAMGNVLHKPARLFPVPAPLLKLAAAMVGQGNAAQRLLGTLQLDITKARELLEWAPADFFGVARGLFETVKADPVLWEASRKRGAREEVEWRRKANPR